MSAMMPEELKLHFTETMERKLMAGTSHLGRLVFILSAVWIVGCASQGKDSKFEPYPPAESSAQVWQEMEHTRQRAADNNSWHCTYLVQTGAMTVPIW